MCALLLFLFGNAGRAEEDAVDDDEDVCRFNIGDGEWVRAAEYRDVRLVDVGDCLESVEMKEEFFVLQTMKIERMKKKIQ